MHKSLTLATILFAALGAFAQQAKPDAQSSAPVPLVAAPSPLRRLGARERYRDVSAAIGTVARLGMAPVR